MEVVMIRVLRTTVSGVLMLGLASVSGCRHEGSSGVPAGMTEASYPVRGRVLSVDPSTQEVMLAHEAVPGFMEAMTMPYKSVDAAALGELHPGDTISAQILVDKDSDGDFHHARLKDIVIVGQARPDTVPQKQYNVPKKGDSVQNFDLLNQDGKTMHLSDLRGKAVLLTFIYTRCPLSDFCPKMSRNFAEVNTNLQKDPATYAKTDLLSVSFDPVYDTPAVLRSYGGAYTGKYTQEKFDHWQFAAPSQTDLPKVEQFFDVGVTGSGTAIQHSLSTVLIGKDGRIVDWYPGNDWKPADVARAMQAAAKA
ncbi:SCO family protein [Terriglobus sp.]|uniref:SCO family protein n=1 Tax=Terriglobus sp. TaxID=1889013 RepID=UPI003B0029FA